MDETTLSRIEKLEIFKHSLEKKIIIATTVATVLGITTLIGGGLINSLVQDLKDLSVKTDSLDERLKQWDSEVARAMSQLDEKETSIKDGIKIEAEKTLNQLLIDFKKESDLRQKTIDLSLKEKKEEISKIGLSDIIKKLNSGSTEMVVKSLRINNSAGKAAIFIGTDNGGDGYFRLNSEEGAVRYQVWLKNNKPLSQYYNNAGVNVLTLGVFNDDDNGFARIYHQENQGIQLELKGDSKGGVLNTYSRNGKNIVYLGPDSKTGNGLVNVMGVNGESRKSHAPN